MVALISCRNREEKLQTEDVRLSVSAGTVEYVSRAGSTSSSAFQGSLGVCLVDETGETYNGNVYSNVLYEYQDGTWSACDDIMLSARGGVLYAYSPFNEQVSSLSSIPVEVYSQTDYLYAEPFGGLSKYAPDASLLMHHAMAAVRLVLVKGTYAGPGEVKSVQIFGAQMPVAAVLDASTGAITSHGGFGESVAVAVDKVLSFTPLSQEILLLPCDETLALEIGLVFDGERRSIVVEDVTLQQGMMTGITLVVNDDGLVTSGVSLQDWTINGENCDVRISGNTEGVAFSHHVASGGEIVVTAVPIEQGCAVDEVEVEGDCESRQSVDAATGVRTIVLSSLREDVLLRFNGAWPLVFRQSFDINEGDVGSDILLFGSETFSHMSEVVETMLVDGVACPLEQYYDFDSPGIHSVEVVLPPDAGVDVTGGSQGHLVSAQIPYCTKKLQDNSFSNSPFLKEVSIPGSVQEIGAYAFYECSSLETVRFGVGVKKIGSDAFYGCVLLEELQLPFGVETISECAFFRCRSLTSVSLPGSVAYVEKKAFSSCLSLSSLSFQKDGCKVNLVGPVVSECPRLDTLVLPAISGRSYQICCNCPNLSAIWVYDKDCPMRLTQSDYAFEKISAQGTLHVPVGAEDYETWLEELGDGWNLDYVEN